MQADPLDKRVRRITLTSQGYALLDHDPLAELAAAVLRLRGDDQESLRDGLEKVLFELHPQGVQDKAVVAITATPAKNDERT